MNVLIPMSGTGSRFLNAGFKTIKPLINVLDKPIIQHIIEKFSPSDNFIFICRQEHLIDDAIQLKEFLMSLASNVQVLEVENHKLGPVHSILEVRDFISLDEEIIVNYCDFDWRWNYTNFIKWINIECPDAALCVYSGFQPHYLNPSPYAHIMCDQHNLIEIKEKESFTKYRSEEPAASGTFYFKKGRFLLDSCDWLKNKNETINGEFYVSLIFNYFPVHNNRCLIYNLNNFMQWGTPEDLKEFNFFAEKIPLSFEEQNINSAKLVLMANNDQKSTALDKVKKPYLNISNTYLYQLCTKNFNSLLKNIFVIRGDIKDNEFWKDKELISKVSVGNNNSSAESLLIALESSDLKNINSIFIMPFDTSIDFDWNKLLTFIKLKNGLDGIIFSHSNYPLIKWIPDEYDNLLLTNDSLVKKINVKTDNNSSVNPIVTGYFWFPDVHKLKSNLTKFLNKSQNTNNKETMSQFCNFLIEKENLIFSYEVKDFLPLRLPLELRTYEYWIAANAIHPFR